jgi:hypothetical protein
MNFILADKVLYRFSHGKFSSARKAFFQSKFFKKLNISTILTNLYEVNVSNVLNRLKEG